MTRLIATFFGVGLLPGAPGTWGSLAALPLAMLLHYLGGFPLLAAATLAIFFAGWWATAAETANGGDHDPSEIVIDEVAGQLVALFPLSAGLWLMDRPPQVFPWPGWVAAFVLFRFFDIVKPFPVSWADRKPTPLGVMLDDIVAGVLAALVVLVSAAVAHGWFR